MGHMWYPDGRMQEKPAMPDSPFPVVIVNVLLGRCMSEPLPMSLLQNCKTL